MNVLVSTSTFPIRENDGTPRFVYDLADALSCHCNVTVLSPAIAGCLRDEKSGNLDIHRFNYFWPPQLQRLAYGHGMRDNMRDSWIARVQPPFFVVAQMLALRSLIQRRHIEIVNSHWMIPQGLSAALLRRIMGQSAFQHIVSVHAADVYMLQKLPLGRRIARFIIQNTDKVFAVGSHVRDALNDLLGFDSGAILQSMGVQCRLFGAAGLLGAHRSRFSEGYLLFFGRFAEKKGIPYLLQAMPRVLERHPGIGLILIGYGKLEPMLREQAHHLEIEANIEFAGRKSHEEIVSYLHGSRAAVVPSIIDSHGETEGMPTVVVEAMAAGIRVVGSAVDGIPDVLKHQRNGWLCREKDPDDLADKILMALDDSADSSIPRAALETAENYDWQQIARHYHQVFESVRSDQPDGKSS